MIAGTPQISVVIPCFNAEDWIGAAIESVRPQAHGNMEIIAVDDGSTDGTVDVLKRFGSGVRWVTGPNRGACHARNRGLRLALSEYVVFLDADDYLDPHYVVHLAERLFENAFDLVLTSFVLERDDGTRSALQRAPAATTHAELMIAWLTGPNPYTSAMVFRANFLRKIGGWNEDVPILQDFELGLRAVLARPRVGYSPQSLAVYCDHASEGRLSRRIDGRAWQGVVNFLDRQAESIEHLGSDDASRAFGAWYYRAARKLYQAGYFRDGDRALRRARRLGFETHLGSTKDVLLARSIGLRNREILGLMKRSILRRTAPRLSAG